MSPQLSLHQSLLYIITTSPPHFSKAQQNPPFLSSLSESCSSCFSPKFRTSRMSPLSKTTAAFCSIHSHADGGDDGYDYAPAASMEGDDDDDGDYDYAPAA
ncbi:hypothetical protein OIU77_019036 [Salix suchowensis]|uniref:Uncharacterized protein n=1 Tax=Salix suchowensis TaxID=1278906 RepID=A0ABQ9CER1_9ROSI|nr:hypothetical protein OIU77_019036 [Salix suchowensis]